MENKAIIVTVINGLLSALLTYKEWGFYIISGWKTETIITAVIGAIVGAIIAAKKPPKNIWVWIGLSVVFVLLIVLYSNLLDTPSLPVWLIFVGLLLLLGVLIIASCIVAYFELEIAKLFSPKKSGTEKPNDYPS